MTIQKPDSYMAKAVEVNDGWDAQVCRDYDVQLVVDQANDEIRKLKSENELLRDMVKKLDDECDRIWDLVEDREDTIESKTEALETIRKELEQLKKEMDDDEKN